MKHEIFFRKGQNGAEWDYFIDTHFAWLPVLLNTGQVFPAFVWFSHWYETYPVDSQGKVIEMYRVRFTSDPRAIGQEKRKP